MNHTPGPWKTCGADRGGCLCCQVWSEPSDIIVAVALQAEDEDYTGGMGCSLDAAKANARLIAAAPIIKQERDELLEACEFVLDVIKAEVGVSTFWDDPKAHWKEPISCLEFAIAKATEPEGKL